VSNAEEFGDWLAEVRGNHAVVVSEHRPVPLWQHMLVGNSMFDLFVNETAEPHEDGSTPRVSPDLVQAIRGAEHQRADGWVRGSTRDTGRGPERARDHGRDLSRTQPRNPSREHGRGPGRGGSGVVSGGPAGRGDRGFARGGRPGGGATRAEVIAQLDRDGLLPAITFIFSRMGCEGAVGQLLSSDTRLIPQREGERIRRHVEERMGSLAEEDLGILGYFDFVEGLSRGFACHHAGMLPLFREIVEELFTSGRIRAVFATETLALGINMPARTVVLEKLVKFNGETHADITPAEYTQLTGRAGRRGIDIEGHAVVQWSRGLDPLAVGGLASTRTYPLRSSFKPTYNMAVNLVAQVGRQVARDILETSFAQFQADRAVVGLATKVRRNDEALDGYAESMHCDRGDFREYADLRRAIADAEKDGVRKRSAGRRAEAAVSLEKLKMGDVIKVPAGKRSGWAVVVQTARTGKGAPSGPGVVTEDRQFRRLTLVDVPEPVEASVSITVPKHFNPKSPKARRDLATTMRIAVPHDAPPPRSKEVAQEQAQENDRIAFLRNELKAHPCHQCPDREDHARWAERWHRLKRETSGLKRKVEGRTNSVARVFDRICVVLTQLGYLEDGVVTERGERLRRLYTERDLLAAECLRHDVWKRLDAPGLAACVSTLVHEPRHEQADPSPKMPNDEVAAAITEMQRRWSVLDDLEGDHGLETTNVPDGGMAWMVHRWASGERLDAVLRGNDMAAGDFVRRCKQIVDLLGQIADAAPDTELRRTARKAIDGVRRGVVSADRLN